MLKGVSKALITTASEVNPARNMTEFGQNHALMIKSIIRNYAKTLHPVPTHHRTSSAQLSLLGKLGTPGRTQERGIVSNATFAELKNAIPKQITVAPEVPVMQNSDACDAYASKVLKGYKGETSDGAHKAEENPPQSLLEKLRIMFEGKQDTTGTLLTSGAKLLETYMQNGPFIIKGSGLGKDVHAHHAMPVMAVVKVNVDGTEKIALIAIDRNDLAQDAAAAAVRKLASDMGTTPGQLPQAALNQHPDLRDEYDRSCIRVIDADAAVKQANEMYAHYDARGMHLPSPGTEYPKQGLKPITPEQEMALKPAIVAAYRNGEVEAFEDVDYSRLEHRKAKK